MRTFSLVLLGLAVGAALLSRSPSRPAPTPVSYTHLTLPTTSRV